jgi:hypothetical protein
MECEAGKWPARSDPGGPFFDQNCVAVQRAVRLVSDHVHRVGKSDPMPIYSGLRHVRSPPIADIGGRCNVPICGVLHPS